MDNKELIEKGETCNFDEILADIKQRDHNDSTRAISPLRKADDAIEIDTSYMSIDEVADAVMEIVESCLGEE